jgi:ATP-binding cassette subfamily B protein
VTVPRTYWIGGGTGAGKSTVVRLVARFFDVNDGAVRVKGVDVRELTTPELMGQIAPVFQDVFLVEGTIEENIRLGRPSATRAAVRRAAEMARVDEMIDRLPGGWSAQVGEAGGALSGGERQRISIARAILKDAPIVLLDEALERGQVVEAGTHDQLLASGRTYSRFWQSRQRSLAGACDPVRRRAHAPNRLIVGLPMAGRCARPIIWRPG